MYLEELPVTKNIMFEMEKNILSLFYNCLNLFTIHLTLDTELKED